MRNYEWQVVSQPLAKRMQELGFPQESLFYRVRLTDTPDGREDWLLQNRKWGDGAVEEYSAFTVAELYSLLYSNGICDILITVKPEKLADYLAQLLCTKLENK